MRLPNGGCSWPICSPESSTTRHAAWLIPVLLFGALAFMYDGLFLGLTEGAILRNAMLVSTLLVFVPPALLAASRQSNDLLWFAMAAFMLARTVTLALAARKMLRRSSKSARG